MKKRIYIDMDGVLAQYEQDAYTGKDPKWLEPGYFAHRAPMKNMIEAVKLLSDRNEEDLTIYILSSVPTAEAADDKRRWLKSYLPKLSERRILFAKCGESKAGIIPGGLDDCDILIDDRCVNLHDWESFGGRGVRVRNGINRGRSWNGNVIDAYEEPYIIAEKLRRYIRGRKYELTDETAVVSRHVLHRIRALKDIELSDGDVIRKGDLGGFIENDTNLSHEGNCWVRDYAMVFGNAGVYGDAVVERNAAVYDSAWIGGKAQVTDEARICGKAVVCGEAMIEEYAKVCGCTQIVGDAVIGGDVLIRGHNLGDIVISEGYVYEGDIYSMKDVETAGMKRSLPENVLE